MNYIISSLSIILAGSMPHRVDAVIKADGWYTKY